VKRPSRRRGAVSVEVDVDINDVLDEIDDQTLIDELAARGKHIDKIDRVMATEAYRELMAGRASSALAALERALFASAPADKPAPVGIKPLERLMILPGQQGNA
jgi:hypothetical protein